MPGRQWTQSMVDAWKWAVATIERGLTATEGLDIYRESGYHIRDSDWYYLTRKARDAATISGYGQSLAPTEIVPAGVHTEVDIDFEKKYVAVATVRYKSELTGETITRNITVESDMLMTLDEWQEEIFDTAGAYPDTPAYPFIDIKRLMFYTPSWAW